MTPLVSIILPFYNEKEQQVHRCLDSVINQTYPNIEIIVVLDNPENELIHSIINSYKQRTNNIIYHVNEANKGVSYSRNVAINIAKGEYIALQDGDDFSHADRIEKQVKFMLDNPDVDVSGSGIIWIDENNPENRFYIYEKRPPEVTIKYYCPISNPSFFAKKSTFEKYGGFPDGQKYAEDYILMTSWFLKGAKFANLNDYLVDYYRDVSGSNALIRKQTWNGMKIRFGLRKELKLEVKNYIKMFFYDFPFFVLLPRKIVNFLVFFNNIYIKRNNRKK